MQSIKQSMLRLRKGVAKFGGKKPNKAAIKLPLRDGDIERDDEAYKGHWNVVRNNATFKAYYDAKRAEGRSHYNALGHCAGKLVRVIWKMLTDEVEFNLE